MDPSQTTCSSGVPFYSVENVTADNFSDTKFISREEHAELIKRCRPEKGDILLTRIGSLGKTKLLDWDLEASIYVSIALLKLKHDINAQYVYCYTKTKQFVQDLESRSLLNASFLKRDLSAVEKAAELVLTANQDHPFPGQRTKELHSWHEKVFARLLARHAELAVGANAR